MTITITSNADLPTCLNTEAKQVKKAKQLAHAHCGVPAKKARGPRIQGFFSRTMIVTMQDSTEVVIQFRPEPLDTEPFVIAERALGPVVPDIKLLQDEELDRNGVWAYFMTRIPGQTWFEGIQGKGPKPVVTINQTLGKILSKGYISDRSDEVVDDKIRPHLQLLLASDDENVVPFQGLTKDLLDKLDQLKALPLFVSHFDLNEMNVMVDANCEVTGIIDWELSSPLPFGMGFSRIHTLAGEFSERKFHMPDEFEESERAFWNEIREGVPTQVRKVLDTSPDAVQTGVITGTLLSAFELEDGKLGPQNPVVVEALPKFLSYRVPFLRGDDPPYSK